MHAILCSLCTNLNSNKHIVGKTRNSMYYYTPLTNIGPCMRVHCLEWTASDICCRSFFSLSSTNMRYVCANNHSIPSYHIVFVLQPKQSVHAYMSGLLISSRANWLKNLTTMCGRTVFIHYIRYGSIE